MIVCDIDGTLFDTRSRSHLVPADKSKVENWQAYNHACHLDRPILPMIQWVKYMARHHDDNHFKQIVFLTSRCESAREQTAEQLFNYFNAFKCQLIMRPIDNHDTPAQFKREKLHELNEQYRNLHVIDDNSEIVNMVKCHFPQMIVTKVPSLDCTTTECAA